MADPFDLQQDPVTLAEMRSAIPWRVFRMNDCEWWVARTLEEAKLDAARNWGISVEQAEKDEMYDEPYELSGEEMRKLKFQDTDENERPCGQARLFSTELARRVAAGLSKPEMFACTEY